MKFKIKYLLCLWVFSLTPFVQANPLAGFRQISCEIPEKMGYDIWSLEYNSKPYFVIDGYYMAGGLTEEIENGGVPIYKKLLRPGIGYELSAVSNINGENVFILKSPVQIFFRDLHVILRTSDFKEGVMERGSFESGRPTEYPRFWQREATLPCKFL